MITLTLTNEQASLVRQALLREDLREAQVAIELGVPANKDYRALYELVKTAPVHSSAVETFDHKD